MHTDKRSIWDDADTAIAAAVGFGFIASFIGFVIFGNALIGCTFAAAGLAILAPLNAWRKNIRISYLGLLIVLILFFAGLGAFLVVLKIASTL